MSDWTTDMYYWAETVNTDTYINIYTYIHICTHLDIHLATQSLYSKPKADWIILMMEKWFRKIREKAKKKKKKNERVVILKNCRK